MSIKRNADAAMKVEVGLPLDSIRSIEFLFKKEKNPACPELLKKGYRKEEIEVFNGESDENGFVMLMRLKPEETYRLTVGKVYMDTYAVLNDGTSPNIPIVPVEDIEQTLYNEVHRNENTG